MTFASASLDDLFEIARGGSPRPIDQYITDDDDGVNWIMISDASASSKYIERTKRRIKPSGVSKSRRVKPGDFLLTNSMSFGRPYILRTDGCIHDGWLVLSPKRNDVDADYFYHLLGSDVLYAEFSRRAAGATVKNLNIDLVKGVEVTFPPIAEQKRIAAILDAADALRAKRRAALTKLDTLAQSIFVEMFGNPIANERGYPTCPLNDLVDDTRGISYGVVQRGADQDEGVPLVRIGDIVSGDLKIKNLVKTTLEVSNQYRRTLLRGGELLISIRGTVGAVAHVPDDVSGINITREVAQIPLLDACRWRFVLHFLRTWPVQRRLIEDVKGVAQSGINLADLREIQVILPPNGLIAEFESRIKLLEDIQTRFEASMSKASSLVACLQHRAFRGELTTSQVSEAA